MISYVRGELAAVEPQKAVVDVGGVGYGVYMSQQALSLLPQPGNEVKLFTYLNVKEDAMQLFGFLTKDDLEIFKLVIGVSGIGPKGGLNILSCMSPDELRFAIMSGDAKAISAAPGIGKKTAEKLILELRDKVDIADMLESAVHGGSSEDLRAAEAESGMQAEARTGSCSSGIRQCGEPPCSKENISGLSDGGRYTKGSSEVSFLV